MSGEIASLDAALVQARIDLADAKREGLPVEYQMSVINKMTSLNNLLAVLHQSLSLAPPLGSRASAGNEVFPRIILCRI